MWQENCAVHGTEIRAGIVGNMYTIVHHHSLNPIIIHPPYVNLPFTIAATLLLVK